MGIFDGFLSQVGTSLVNNALSQHNARQQREWQEKMMDKQNAYNSPIQDKIRKMAAGVNPYAGELNSVPSASAGTGATAETFPMPDPLSTAFTMAQIRHLDAQTGKTETETEKVLREIANLEQLFAKGIIEKDEMEFKFEKLKEAWKKTSQYAAELKKTESEAAVNEAQANWTNVQSEQVQTSISIAKKQLEYFEQDKQKYYEELNSRIAKNKAETAQAYELARKAKNDADTSEYTAKLAKFNLQISQSVGFDVTAIPPASRAILQNSVMAYIQGDISIEKLDEVVTKVVSDLANTETYINGSTTQSANFYGYTGSHTFNANTGYSLD